MKRKNNCDFLDDDVEDVARQLLIEGYGIVTPFKTTGIIKAVGAFHDEGRGIFSMYSKRKPGEILLSTINHHPYTLNFRAANGNIALFVTESNGILEDQRCMILPSLGFTPRELDEIARRYNNINDSDAPFALIPQQYAVPKEVLELKVHCQRPSDRQFQYLWVPTKLKSGRDIAAPLGKYLR